MAKELRILSVPTFGFRFSDDLWAKALSLKPDFLVGQGTSSDGGPNYVGMDRPYGGLPSVRQDLDKILVSAKEKKIPFVFSAGSPSGSNVALEHTLRLVQDIALERNLTITVAVIPGEVGKEYLRGKIRKGTVVKRMEEAAFLSEVLTEEEVGETYRILAQMGPEPMMEGLRKDVDGVLCGRSLDVGLYMAPAMMKGFDKGLAAHFGKCLECGALVCVPQSLSPVFGVLSEDHFTIQPVDEHARVTCESIIAHALYERASPYEEPNPGGVLDLSSTSYEQIDERCVRVSGSRWIEQPYRIKIEGVKLRGFRTISIGGVRDERLIRSLDEFLASAREHIAGRFGPEEESYTLLFRRYGIDGVLGDDEPLRHAPGHEVGLVIDVVANTQQLADAICTMAVDFVLHMDYPERLTTAGNIAIPYSPREIPVGPVYTYNIWHLLDLEDPCEPFKISVRRFPEKGVVS